MTVHGGDRRAVGLGGHHRTAGPRCAGSAARAGASGGPGALGSCTRRVRDFRRSGGQPVPWQHGQHLDTITFGDATAHDSW